MTTVLLVGGAGYIGSHCAKALAGKGFSPVVFDDFSTGYRGFVQWGPFVEGDVRDISALRHAFEQFRPDAVMHFAALIGVADSFDRPSLYEDVNVGGTKNILAVMQECGVSKIVYSSTAAVYGMTEPQPIDESAPVGPASPYSETKWRAEELIAEQGRSAGIDAVVLRYFNAAGASGEAEIGEDHRPETHLIPLVLDAAMGRRKDIQVFGGDYPTPDGSAIRDYIHVCDLADAHVAALAYLLEGGGSLTCNLGTGTGHSVLEVIRTAQSVVGRPISHRIAPRRQGDPHSLVAANGIASDRLGWTPQRSCLETIIRDAWRWHETRFS